ncbi:MAG: Ca-activated chloride channel family protein, partial [Akkermansiaceae bacterium]
MEFISLTYLSWVLPVFIIALAVTFWALSQRRRAIALLTQNAEQCKLRSNASPIRRRILFAVLLSALILSLIAVLRPIGGTEMSEHRRPAKNLVVLLDVSNSMTATDADGISRIEAAKLLLREFINKRPTDKIGLLSFAGATFIESPVTLDRSRLLDKVNKIQPGQIPVGGTDIDSALREAQKLLTDEPPPGSAIVILSDGDNVTGRKPDEVLAQLKKSGIPIIAVAVGKDGIDTAVPRTNLSTKADHATLLNLADSTNGLFLAASPKEVDAQVAKLSERVDTIELNGENIAADIYERPLDLYFWPLALALLCLMIHLFLPLRTKIWRPLTTALVLSLTLPQSIRAEQFDTYEEALEVAKAEELPLLVIFTGSDWSKLSITFEREILSHQVFQKWANAKVVRALIDLPRVGIAAEERDLRRALAKKLGVESYPMAVFLDEKEQILGTLTHDPDGPDSWTKRANAILAGEEAASDTAASIEYLPKEVRNNLDDPNLTAAQRSVRHYNKALEMEKAGGELTLESKDRFQLLLDLYNKAVNFAPIDRPDLIFSARHKMALLHHRKGQSLIPKSQEDLMMLSMKEKLKPIPLLKKARRSLKNALGHYKNAAPLKPNDQELSGNFALAYQNVNRVQAYLDYLEAYQAAIENTMIAVAQEKRFADSLDREVTTRLEVNKLAIADSATAIQDLIAKSEVIEDQPTILAKEGLSDYRLADEDIVLAPSPHRER